MDMLEQWRQEDQTGASPTRPNVRGALESASDVDAQKIARSRELAGKLGLPEPLVMADLDRAERESKVKTLDSAPLLANWAAEDRMHAALAANEPEKLVELFDYTGTGIKTDAGINIDPLARSYDQGTIQVKLSQLGERYRAGDASVINDITTLREKMNPYAQQDAYGMILPGNGAQASATVLQDGGHATSVPSLIREIDGKFALLPKLSQDGRLLSDDEALQQFIQTGSHAGIFATARDALTFVRLPEGKRQGLAQSWKQKPKESWAERIGMGTAAEQIPIMMSLQIPSATEAMGMGIAVWGASTLATAGSGAAVGTVVPGPGTAIGAAGGATLGQGVAVSSGMLAAKTTYLTRVAQRSFNLERGSFIAELALEKDENGQPLPKNIQNAASDIYGVMAAAIETGGEALFLRLLKPLGIGDVAEGSAKAFIKSAVKRAVFDQSVRGKLIDIAARLGINSLSEGLEEGLQQAAQALVEYGAKGVANASGTDFENDLFSPKNFTDVIESAQKGAAAGFWLGGGPIMVSGAFQVQEAKSAQSFAKRQSEIHTLVEATQLKQLSPQHMEGALEAAGPAMQSSVQLPADAVLELFQNGTDLISPLGYTEQEVAKLADMGQQIEVPLSRLHARLDQVQFDAAASIMRQSPAGVSAAEAANTQNRIEHDAAILIEHEQQRQEQQNAFEAERERLRVDVTSAIESVPGLQVQAQTMAGSVSAYVDTLLQVWGSMARRLTPKGGDTAATLRKLVVHRLEKAQRTARSGRMPEENVSPLASLPDETLARVMSMEGIDPTYAPLDRFSPAEQQILRDAGIVETVEREGRDENGNSSLYEAARLDDLFKERNRRFEAHKKKRHEDRENAERSFADEEEAMRRHLSQMSLRERDPVLGEIWGRLDGKSLAQYDGSGSYSALVKKYGLGLFRSKSRGGVPIDVLADGLVRAGLLPEGSGANELLDKLNDGGQQYFQPSQEDVLLADEALARDVEAWGKAVDAVGAAKTAPSQHVVMLNQTPLILQMIGADFLTGKRAVDGGLYVSSHTFENAITGRHGVTLDMLKQIPEAMVDPIAIFDSSSEKGKGDVVFMLELKDKQGRTVVVPVALQGAGQNRKTINIVKSAYGKGGQSPAVQWFLDQAKKNARYVNGQKYEHWQEDSGVQFSSGYANVHGNTIYTDADLVKLREANPTLYQSAYHGSPHRFDWFDLEHIGSGEGAQAFGWGLYFAGDKDIAEWYREKLSNEESILVDGNRIVLTNDGWVSEDGYYLPHNEADAVAADYFHKHGEDAAQELRIAIKEAEEYVEEFGEDGLDVEIEELKEALGYIEDGLFERGKPGQLYEVDIPEDSDMLAWDKSLSDQPEMVRTALIQALRERVTTKPIPGGPFVDVQFSGESLGAFMPEKVANAVEHFDELLPLDGESIYGMLSKELGSDQAASEYLNSIGIKGIRYLDGNSRNKDGESHNYVVFDDAAIDIVKTYYQRRSGSPRGSVQIFPEKYLISLFKQANLSTLLHETGHIFLAELGTLIHSGAADEVMTADYQRILDWLGAKPGKKLSVRQQEQFARGFEAYLMEGKAPTRELSSAFARFKNWLLRIYREAKSLRVELTDEMRGVFDRLLATDAEIAEVATGHELLSLTEKELDALNLTGPARTYAAGLMDAAKDSASEQLRQDRDRQRRERLARYTLEARKEARADPVQQTRRAMRDTPLDLEAVREAFGQDTAEKLMRALPASLKNGGLDPEIFAAQHGFENAAAMMREVLAAPSLRDAVADLVATKEAAHDTTFNDRAADYLIETEQAAEQVELVGRYLAENQQNAHIQQESFAQAARQELTTMPMGKATQSGRFTVALRDAMRRMRQAIADGNFAAALEANHKARLNMEFARQSLDIARQQQVIQNRIQRFISMAKGDPAARFAVMDVGMRHGLAKFSPPLADNRDSSTIRTWISAAESDGYTLYVDDAVLYGPGKPWREMSVADFSSLIETVNQLVTVERNQRQVSTAQGKAELDAVAGSIAAGIYSHRRPEQTKTVERDPAAKKMLASVHAVHTKIEALCIALDGDKHGPAWEYIYKPITDAEDRQSVRFKQVRLDLNRPDLFGAYSRKELADMCRKKTFVPEVGEKLTRENRIAVALNLGNAANINRIKEGHGWTDEQIAAVVRDLDKRDWDFVQSVWDYLDTFREEAFALQESITGLRPQAVQAQPVSTPHGTYRGGYYPIRYNADKGFRAFEQEQAAMDKELFGGRNYGAAMTKNGHLKERAKLGQQSPLLLELSVITDHVFNVVHDLSYRQAVLDVAKVLRHKTVREAMESTVGKEMYRQLMPWLQDVANERQEPMHYVHKLTRWARSSTSIMQMGFKITTMLTQPIGFTQSIELLGYGYVGQGLKRVYGNPLRLPALIEETFARSPMMEGRIKGFDREVRDFTKRLQPGMGRFAWLDAIRDNAFVPMGLFQMSVDLPTWWGAYEKGIKDHGGDEILAAQYADSVVRMAQGSGATKDLARIQRGGDMARMFTMFYSYFNTFYNLAARRITALQHDRSPAAVMQAAHTALLLWFIPAVLSELVAGRGPDDDEDPAKWAGMNMLQYPFQAVVGLRDVASAVFGEYGYAITPAESAPESVVKWFKSVNKALEKEDAGLLTKPTVEAVGYLFGLPLKQPIITVGTMWDWLTGDDPDLFVRDLFFVKPKSRRQ